MSEVVTFISNAGGSIVSKNILSHKGKLRWCVREELKDMGLTNDQLGPAIAGAYDRTTGKIYTSINDYDGKVPTELAPIIRE